MINELNKRFLEFSFNGENKSINESMILFYGTHDSKVIPVGYDIWVREESYQGVKKGKQDASFSKWGLGENILL